jgi:hypothetical protein
VVGGGKWKCDPVFTGQTVRDQVRTAQTDTINLPIQTAPLLSNRIVNGESDA